MLTPTRTQWTFLALGGLLLTLVALAGAAAAQTDIVNARLAIDLTSPGQPFKPGDVWNGTGTLTYTWDTGAFAQGPTTVDLTVEGGGWFTIAITPSTLEFTPTPLQGGTGEASFTVTVTANPDAPAKELGNATVHATARPNGNLKGHATSSTLAFASAFTPKTVVTAATEQVTVKGGTPQTLSFTVRNDGNGDVNVGFAVSAPPEVTTTAPEPITLTPGEERTVSVTVKTPWTSGITGDLVLTATSTPAGGEGTGDTAPARVGLVSTSAVPASGLAIWLPAITLAALALRRRL